MALNSDCRVTISADQMSATLHLTPPPQGEPYTVEDLADHLRHNGVNYGIIFSALEDTIKANAYPRDVVVAQGKEAVHGVNGYYEFFFEQDNQKNKRPLIRSDGSVDYQSMNVIHNVRAGDKLAVYHPAIEGSHGMDVGGRELRAHPAKDLPELHGNGFDRSYDGLTYTANIEGKVEYDNYKLFVKDVYEFKGDLDQIVGKIDFRGDVIVHGNVCTGTMIRASKSITVEGSVEAATLIADGDIVLKKGMQGGKKAKIVSGGSIYANFIEFTDVEAKENVEANIILNCRVNAGKDIVVSGKRGAIVGGSVYCVGTVSTTLLGNNVGIRTRAAVGAGEDIDKRNHLLRVKCDSTKESLAKTMIEIQTFKTNVSATESKEVREAKMKQLERRKVRDERLLEHVEKELAKIKEMMDIAKEAKVTVSSTAYSNCLIRIDDQELELKSNENNVEFFREPMTEGISRRPAV
ncbi:MAG: FapA family protein [Lachnospiraceae bacterium]|nr:FapA family protein [Lachnospiraceae bacterium]